MGPARALPVTAVDRSSGQAGAWHGPPALSGGDGAAGGEGSAGGAVVAGDGGDGAASLAGDDRPTGGEGTAGDDGSPNLGGFRLIGEKVGNASVPVGDGVLGS